MYTVHVLIEYGCKPVRIYRPFSTRNAAEVFAESLRRQIKEQYQSTHVVEVKPGA